MKRKWPIACAASAAATLVFLLVFFLPEARRSRRITASMAIHAIENKEAAAKIELAGDLANKAKAAQQELESYERCFPDPADKLEVLNSIDRISRKSDGIQPVSLTMVSSKEQAKGNLEKQLFSVALEGSYEEIAKFLHDLTNMTTPITVEELRISRSDGSALKVAAIVACYFTNHKTTTAGRNAHAEQGAP